LVRIPKFYYKITNIENELKFQISSKPKDGFYVSPAHMNRNDGYGERDYVYIGRYKYESKYTSSSYKYYDSNPTTNIYIQHLTIHGFHLIYYLLVIMEIKDCLILICF
jgi:hypothetical protein